MGATLNQADLQKILRKIDGVEEVARRSTIASQMNKVAREVRNEAIDRAKRELPKTKASRIRRAIKLRRASPVRLEAVIDVERKPANWINFGAAQLKAGVRVFAAGQRKLIKGAFVVRGKWVARRRARERLPIDSLPGPSIGGVLKKHVDELLAFARRDLSGELRERLRKVLG